MNIEQFCELNDVEYDDVAQALSDFAHALNKIFGYDPLDGDQTSDVAELVQEYFDVWNGVRDEDDPGEQCTNCGYYECDPEGCDVCGELFE
jgi:hypothetical protein